MIVTRRWIVLVAFVAVCALSACAPRAEIEMASPVNAMSVERIFLATSRQPIDPPLAYGDLRADEMSFAVYDIAVPENHESGALVYPTESPVPSRQFTVARAGVIQDISRFGREIAAEGRQSVGVFVHGYNSTLAEAVYRHAQMSHDLTLEGPQVTFAWASAARALGYIHDRDSVAVARDDLEQLLLHLARDNQRDIVLVGHSMGAHLVMETLRQMAIGGRQINDRLSGVLLISPDIDIALFLRQIDRIRPLPKPFAVTVSQDDRALRLSARLAGQGARLGSLSDIEQLRALDITVIDLSDAADADSSNHFVAASAPDAIALLRGLRTERGYLTDRNPGGLDLLTLLDPRAER